MKAVDLNELPQWSSWPSRLLGLDDWNAPDRTIQKVDQEYDKDKYAKCLAYYAKSGESVTPETVKRFEFGKDVESTICVSANNELALMSLEEARSRFYQLLVQKMSDEIEQCHTVIELGCGYGYNLWVLQKHFPDVRFRGGEYSEKAVHLASDLFSANPVINIVRFNFYDSAYHILEEVSEPVLVFTVHAIEQLPRSTPFFETLSKYQEKIRSVFHFEPMYEHHDSTLLGLMRQRYAEVNDYNRDLLSQLRQRSDYIRVVRAEADVFGLNPLNPTSVIHWEFL